MFTPSQLHSDETLAASLNGYFQDHIDETVIEKVQQVYHDHKDLTYEEMVGMYEDRIQLETIDGTRGRPPAQLYIYTPNNNANDGYATIMHAPIFVPAGANPLFRIMLNAAAHPDERIVHTLSPAGFASRYNKLPFIDMPAVAQGNFEPYLDMVLGHLGSLGVQAIINSGYSFGEATALAASNYSIAHNITTEKAILKEPVVGQEKFWHLLRNFIKTTEPFNDYVNENRSNALLRAKELDNIGLRYYTGFLAATSIATAIGLTSRDYENLVTNTLRDNPDLRVAIVWGSKSELSPDAVMQEVTDRLQAAEHIGNRVVTRQLNNMRHAGGENLLLQLAIDEQSRLDLDSIRV